MQPQSPVIIQPNQDIGTNKKKTGLWIIFGVLGCGCLLVIIVIILAIVIAIINLSASGVRDIGRIADIKRVQDSVNFCTTKPQNIYYDSLNNVSVCNKNVQLSQPGFNRLITPTVENGEVTKCGDIATSKSWSIGYLYENNKIYLCSNLESGLIYVVR